MNIVAVDNLVKRYNEVLALDHFSLHIESGEVFGLLGPNGSGKTTAINCILQLLTYDKGTIELFGQTMRPSSYDLKRRIGIVPQNVAVFEELTVRENIKLAPVQLKIMTDAEADKRAIELFERLRAIGFSTCILSNNKEPRVSPFADKVGSPYIFKGGKPSRKGYERAMERMKTDRDTTFFVGDQLFTDVWGANRTGLYSILVKPINPKEEIQIVLKRYLEAVVLMFYRKRLKKTGRTAGDFCKK